MLINFTFRKFGKKLFWGVYLRGAQPPLSPSVNIASALFDREHTAWTIPLRPFSACDILAVRAARVLKLKYIDGIWSSRQNKSNFSKIGPEIWTPGPKNRKKSKPQKSWFFDHFLARFFRRRSLKTLVFFDVEKRSWSLKNSQTLCYPLKSVLKKFDKKWRYRNVKSNKNLVTRRNILTKLHSMACHGLQRPQRPLKVLKTVK